jgi:hypothetical protein
LQNLGIDWKIILIWILGVLVGISEGKRQFAKSMHRLEDNINMDLMGFGGNIGAKETISKIYA